VCACSITGSESAGGLSRRRPPRGRVTLVALAHARQGLRELPRERFARDDARTNALRVGAPSLATKNVVR
jgi:hypothetical protein